MPSLLTCQVCNKSFSAKANLKRHVRNCHGEGHRVQCPYCNKIRSRVDDLIRHHIVNNHPEKVGEMLRDKTLITTVPSVHRSPDKKRVKREDVPEDTTPREMPKQVTKEINNASVQEPLIGKPISPLKSPHQAGDSIQADSPTLFRRLDTLITRAGGEVETEKPNEIEQAMASILPPPEEALTATSAVHEVEAQEENSSVSNTEVYVPREDVKVLGLAVQATEAAEVPKLAVEQEASEYPGGIPVSVHHEGDMYIPNCESTASQYSPRKEIPPAEPNPPFTSVMPPPQSQPLFHTPSYLETHCPHGIKIPTHIHIRRCVKKPNGEVIKTKEILVNCARCPPPVIHIVAKVDQPSMRRATQLGPPSVASTSSRASEMSSIMSDSDSD